MHETTRSLDKSKLTYYLLYKVYDSPSWTSQMQERAKKSPSTLEQFSQTRTCHLLFIQLNPRTTPPIPAHIGIDYRVSGRVATDIVFSNALLVVSVWTIKEWLLSQNVGAFWVLMRVLACGALGLVVREVASGDVSKASEAASSAKVRTWFLSFPSLFY